MKKDELRYDPIHEKLLNILEYLESNKNSVFQILLALVVLVGGWGYYAGNQRSMLMEARSLSGTAQSEYNASKSEISIQSLKEVVEEYAGTDAASQAGVYLIADAYLNNEDGSIESIVEKIDSDNVDNVIHAGILETLGNAKLNANSVESAEKYFKKAVDKGRATGMDAQYQVGLALANIMHGNYQDAKSILAELLESETLNFNDKNKAEELQAQADFHLNN
jgi:predicted negative regulator of RcsB-dependent stress response